MLSAPPPDAATLAGWCDRATTWSRPGRGHTEWRWRCLAAVAYDDLVVGRLVEAHADAIAICEELGGDRVGRGQRWGVWAAGPPDAVHATLIGTAWRLSGTKQWCSGATIVSHALVDAASSDGQRLFAVDLDAGGVHPGPMTWVGPGMARADTRAVSFDAAPAVAVGSPGAYLRRPGFWAGAIGVAACWHGGTARVADAIRSGAVRRPDPHRDVHVGAAHVALRENTAVLRLAAAEIDRRPAADHAVTARSVRTTVERNAQEVMLRAGRALGPEPLAHDGAYAALVSDLSVYVRQHHAERDLADLGRAVAGGDERCWPS